MAQMLEISFLALFVNCSVQIYIQYQLKHVCDRTITVAQSNGADCKKGLSVHYMNYGL